MPRHRRWKWCNDYSLQIQLYDKPRRGGIFRQADAYPEFTLNLFPKKYLEMKLSKLRPL